MLSKAVEKNFALAAEISGLQHHVSVVSKRLHSVTVERRIIEHIVRHGQCPNCSEKEELSGDVVAEGVEEIAATEEVADSREEVRPACEEVAKEEVENQPQRVTV